MKYGNEVSHGGSEKLLLIAVHLGYMKLYETPGKYPHGGSNKQGIALFLSLLALLFLFLFWAWDVDCSIYQASVKQSEMPSANCKHRDIIGVPSGRQTEEHFFPILFAMLNSRVIVAQISTHHEGDKGAKKKKANVNPVRALTLIDLADTFIQSCLQKWDLTST